MGIVERLANLVGDAERFFQGESVLGSLLDKTFYITTTHQLTYQVRLPSLIADVIKADHVRVVAEAAHELGLLLDPCNANLVEPVGLDQGEGDVTVEQGVVYEIDPLLAALTQEAFDFVPTIDE
jgi:hypothetical protein